MPDFVVTTFDWVPDIPRGYVRDIRLRWALEEAGLSYRIEGTSFADRRDAHFAQQPFGQVPWLTHGETSLFESGAILLYLAERSSALMPHDPTARHHVIEWLFAALNSVEMASVPWSIFKFSDDDAETPGRSNLNAFLASRLHHMEQVLAEREWLAGDFSVADIAMVDALRLVDRFGELAPHKASRDYIARGMARPAFQTAHADQIAFYDAADARRDV